MPIHRDDLPALIKNRLDTALSPLHLTLRDDSAAHAHHAGAAAGGHFSVTLVCTAFIGKTRIARHQLVYHALAEMMQCGIHALSITAYTPEEFTQHSLSMKEIL
jgi:BolA family transcriptional regulator, general stress-responsive regulator